MFGLLLFSIGLLGSDSKKVPKTKVVGAFFQVQPIPSNVTIGGFRGNHRAGLYTNALATYYLYSYYKSLGFEYAYHLNGATDYGYYGKIFAEHRRYRSGFRVHERSVETPKGPSLEYDTVDHYKNNHYGALIGYQWLFASPRLYMQAGVGWQYNDNPVRIGSTIFYLGEDTQRRWSTTGEFAFGCLLY